MWRGKTRLGVGVGIGQKSSVLNLNGLKSTMAFWSDSLNFTTNKLVDRSGNDANSPSLIDSYCLVFNGSTTVVQFAGAYVPSISKVLITAQSGSDAWTTFTELTAPTGLWSKSNNILYIGKSGTTFFSGKVARVICLDSSDNILVDIPFSNGFGNYIYGYNSETFTDYIDPTKLVASLEDGTLTDGNADGSPDPLVMSSNYTAVAKTIETVPANGWTGKYAKIVFTTKGAGSYGLLQGSVTPGNLWNRGYFKIRYRTNINTNGTVKFLFDAYSAAKRVDNPAGMGDGTIRTREIYFEASACSQITVYFENPAEGAYFEYDLIQVRKAEGRGNITAGTWSATCPVSHNNLQKGFDLYVDSSSNRLYIPKVSEVKALYLDTLTWFKSVAPSTTYLSDCETKIQFPDVAGLKTIDTGNYIYDSGGTALKLGYSDFVGSKLGYFFSNVYNHSTGVDNIILFNTNPSGSALKVVTNTLKSTDKRLYVDYYSESVIRLIERISAGKWVYRYFLNPSIDIRIFDSYLHLSNEYSAATYPYSVATTIKGNSDDVCPILANGSYIGGNHGYYGMMNVTLAGHGKDATDLGSIWSTAGYNYKLVKIAGNVLSFIQSGTYTTGGYKAKMTFTSGTLTHVSGAVHTTSINAASTAIAQITPAVNKTMVVKADGVIITSGFKGFINTLQFDVVENIYNYLEIENYYPSDLANCPYLIRRNITYIFSANGVQRTKETFTPLLDNAYISGYAGIEQAESMNNSLTGTTKKYFYIPGSTAFIVGSNNYDFRALTDLFSVTPDAIEFTEARRETGKRINRLVEFLSTNTAKTWGFSHGYFSRNNDVNASNIDWLLNSTKKSYPYYYTNLPLVKDQQYTAEAWRALFDATRTDSATCAYIVKSDSNYYLYIDVHTNLSEQFINVPSEIVGLNISVDDKNDNTTIHSTQVTAAGVQVSVINNYGYAVLKLS